MKYVGTKFQWGDLLIKGSFIAALWKSLLYMSDIVKPLKTAVVKIDIDTTTNTEVAIDSNTKKTSAKLVHEQFSKSLKSGSHFCSKPRALVALRFNSLSQ